MDSFFRKGFSMTTSSIDLQTTKLLLLFSMFVTCKQLREITERNVGEDYDFRYSIRDCDFIYTTFVFRNYLNHSLQCVFISF